MPRYTLKLTALINFHISGALVHAGKQAADHDGVTRPRRCALGMSPEYLMPPSAMMVTPVLSAALAQSATAVSCGTPMPATITGGADGARADTDLDHIRARFDQGMGGGGGSHIARDDRQVGVGRLRIMRTYLSTRRCYGREPYRWR